MLAGCDADLGARYTRPPRSFGEIVYTESCERVAFTAELEELRTGQRQQIDASGVAYVPMCRFGEPAPAAAPQVMQAVAGQRQVVIDTVNAIVPEPLLEPLRLSLQAMLPALDSSDGAAIAAVQGLSDTLTRAAADAQVTGALARLGLRDGFRAPSTTAGFLRALLDYPELHGTLTTVLPALAASAPGVDDAPAAAAQSALTTALSYELRAATAVAKPADPERTHKLTLDLLFSTDAELKTLPAGQAYWAVRRDARGVADINRPGGVLPTQFVDRDADGLADVDALGRFVSASGAALPTVSPFPSIDKTVKDNAAARDAAGLAKVSPTGALLYRYQDLDNTLLAALLREAPAIFDADRDIPLRLGKGALHLMGPRVAQHKDYAGIGGLDYSGFAREQAPLLDLVYAYLQLLGYSDLGDDKGADLARFLRGLYLLTRDNESTVSRNLAAMSQAFERAKQPAYDAAKLAEDSTLYDDLAPVLVRLLRQPGLVSELLDALRAPATANLGPQLARLMSNSNYVFMSQSELDSDKPASVVANPTRPVNRAAADSDVDQSSGAQNNRSALQRVLHLVHDANGMQFCNKDNARITTPIPLPGTFKPCELMQIDDLALFYLLSIASPAVKDGIASADFMSAIRNDFLRNGLSCLLFGSLIGIPGFDCTVRSLIPFKMVVYPRPQAAARLLFQDNASRSSFHKDAMDFGACSPKRPGTLCCNQNHSWQADHNGALFALELDPSGNPSATNNFYTAFQPIVDVFAKRDECIARNAAGACTKTQNAGKILADLLSVLHRHWPTVQSSWNGLQYEAANKKSGVSRYEPLIADLLTKTDLWNATLQLGPALVATRLDDGSNQLLSNIVTRFGLWFLDPEVPRLGGKLKLRSGVDSAKRNDGTPTFAPTGDSVILDVISASAQGKVTPFDIFADAYKKKRARLAESPEHQAAWQGGISALADLYLQAQKSGTAYKFQDPRLRAMSLILLDFLRARVAKHGAAGDLKDWAQTSLFADLSDALSGPTAAAALDFSDRLYAQTEARRRLGRFLGDLLADPGPGSKDALRFYSVLSGVADSLQLLLDDADLVPLLRVAGIGLAKETAVADAGLSTLRRALPLDSGQVQLQILRNVFRADSAGLYPGYRLANAIGEIDRKSAGQAGVTGTDFDASDYQALLAGLAQFLGDEKRGVRRLLEIIPTRR